MSSERSMRSIRGTVYLLHFDRPYAHAQHYIGWTRDLEARLAAHASGDGSPLLRAARAAGIAWHVARLWHDVTRNKERSLKLRKDTRALCPECRAARSGNGKSASSASSAGDDKTDKTGCTVPKPVV